MGTTVADIKSSTCRNLLFAAEDKCLVRQAALPFSAGMKALADYAGANHQGDMARFVSPWIGNDDIAPAIWLASRALYDSLSHYGDLSKRDKQRAAVTLLNYINRMATRATPFGLFSGVQVGWIDVAAGPQAAPESPKRLPVVQDIDIDFGLVSQGVSGHFDLMKSGVEVVVDSLVYIGLSRIHGSKKRNVDRERQLTEQFSIAKSRGVLAILRLAKTPIAVRSLVQNVATHINASDESRIAGAVAGLLDAGVLRVAHQPVLSVGAGDNRWLNARLLNDTTHATAVTALRGVLTNRGSGAVLDRRVIAEIEGVHVPVEPGAPLVRADSALRVVDGSQPSSEDVVHVSEQVSRAAIEATTSLIALGSHTTHPAHLRAYVREFVERYGPSAQVPVLELLSEADGLGAPEGYEVPRRLDAAWRPLAGENDWNVDRDQALHRLVAEACQDRRWSVDLAEVSDVLASVGPDTSTRNTSNPIYPAHDIFLSRFGSAELLMSEVGTSLGGRAAARFFNTIPHVADSLEQIARHEAKFFDQRGEAIVDLNYQTLDPRGVNVSAHRGFRDYEINLNCQSNSGAKQLDLSTIRAGVSDGYMQLYSPEVGKRIYVAQASLINQNIAPNVCRFLLEVSQAQFVSPTPFAWSGELEAAAPFLPRVSSGSLILRRARWLLKWSEVADADGQSGFTAYLERWRERWSVPRFVTLTQSDSALTVDLDTASSVESLYKHVKKSRSAVMQEHPAGCPTSEAMDLHATEFVVPVLTRISTRSTDRAVRTYPKDSVSFHARRRSLAQNWIYCKVYIPGRDCDAFLTNSLSNILSTTVGRENLKSWHYIRYADPAEHIRLRFELVPDCGALATEVLAAVVQAVEDGVARGMVLAEYMREPERFGGVEMLPHVEQFFAQDSDYCLDLLSRLPSMSRQLSLSDRLARILLCVDSIALLRSSFGASSGAPQVGWQKTGRRPGGEEFRTLSRHLDMTTVLSPTEPGAPSHAVCAAARTLSSEISSAPHEAAWSSADDIVGALMHLHCNRLGVFPEDEAVAWGVIARWSARDAALAQR